MTTQEYEGLGLAIEHTSFAGPTPMRDRKRAWPGSSPATTPTTPEAAARALSDAAMGARASDGKANCRSAAEARRDSQRRTSTKGSDSAADSAGKKSTTTYRGVAKLPGNKWRAYVYLPKNCGQTSRQKWLSYLDTSKSGGLKSRQKWLGYYDTPKAAARAYDNAALGIRGSLAKLNFPLESAAAIEVRGRNKSTGSREGCNRAKSTGPSSTDAAAVSSEEATGAATHGGVTDGSSCMISWGEQMLSGKGGNNNSLGTYGSKLSGTFNAADWTFEAAANAFNLSTPMNLVRSPADLTLSAEPRAAAAQLAPATGAISPLDGLIDGFVAGQVPAPVDTSTLLSLPEYRTVTEAHSSGTIPLSIPPVAHPEGPLQNMVERFPGEARSMPFSRPSQRQIIRDHFQRYSRLGVPSLEQQRLQSWELLEYYQSLEF